MAKQASPASIDRFFSALADPTRLRILHLLSGRELCVCYFVEILYCPQPKVSRHLAMLRAAGIVTARREGKWMHYRMLEPQQPGIAQILAATLTALTGQKSMQADAARLLKLTCAPTRYAAIAGAPLPASTANACRTGTTR